MKIGRVWRLEESNVTFVFKNKKDDLRNYRLPNYTLKCAKVILKILFITLCKHMED